MDGFKFNDVSDVYVGGTLAKQVYIGSTKVWDCKTNPIYTAPTKKTGLVYNGSAQNLLNAGTTSHGTFYYSTNGTDWSTSIPQSTNAGTIATVYWKLIGDSRHNDVASTSISSITISQKALTITAKAQSIPWGNSIATGTGQVTISGLVNGDSLTGVSLAASTTDITTSGTITPSAASTTKGIANYSVTYSTGTLTITKRNITITAKAQSITYGNSIAMSTSQVTIGGSGLVSGNSLTSISLEGSTSYVGTGTVTPSSAVIKAGSTDVSSKYNVTYATGTLTVSARAITIIANAQTINYGSSISTDLVQVTIGGSGLAGWDGLTAVTLTASTANVPGGTITPSAATIKRRGTDNTSNYTITYQTGTLTINKVNPTYTAPTAKDVQFYSRSPQALINAGTTSGGTMYYMCTTTDSKPSSTSGFSTSIPEQTNAGNYYIWYYVKGDSNHNDTAINSTSILSVIAATTPILSSAPTYCTGLIYNRRAQNLLTGGAMKHSSSDSTAVAGTFTYDQATDAGTYSNKRWRFVPTDTTNYVIVSQIVSSGSCTIAKASPMPRSIPTIVTGLVYNGSAQNLLTTTTFRHSQGDSTAVAGTYTCTQGTNAGSYSSLSWSFTPTDSTNYRTLSGTISGTATIAKANVTMVDIPDMKTGLVYNGQAQELIYAGDVIGGTLMYKVQVAIQAAPTDKSLFNSTIPTGTESNFSRLLRGYYYVEGDANHNSTNITSMSSIDCIAQAIRTITFTSAPTSVQVGESVKVAATVSLFGTINYSCTQNASINMTSGVLTGGTIGSVKVSARSQETSNYVAASASYTLNVTAVNWATRYLMFEAIDDCKFKLDGYGWTSNDGVPSGYERRSYYSLDNGITWNITKYSDITSAPDSEISVSAGNTILWKGNLGDATYSDASHFVNVAIGGSFGRFKVKGNPKSILSDSFRSETSVSSYQFSQLFMGMRGLTDASSLSLPATTLGTYCYSEMFKNCYELTALPLLSATTMQERCYQNMFQGCTALTTIPSGYLPATTLVQQCYQNMFQGCTSLTTAPTLPATTLASGCYSNMFQDCTSLTTAPSVLPATTLAGRCYQQMFQRCTNLTIAPELPATTLASRCYGAMFDGCTSLNYVKAMFTTTPSSTYTSNWLRNVASTGTFVKNADATWNVSGNNGIPSGWTTKTGTLETVNFHIAVCDNTTVIPSTFTPNQDIQVVLYNDSDTSGNYDVIYTFKEGQAYNILRKDGSNYYLIEETLQIIVSSDLWSESDSALAFAVVFPEGDENNDVIGTFNTGVTVHSDCGTPYHNEWVSEDVLIGNAYYSNKNGDGEYDVDPLWL